ncbi:hypothetical protein FD754_015982 [Muntiacus muntjak]|uniref:Sphingolipid delta4-desaturase N-terminal domain-containing protein n=1 Tax=Muntiacus muntjak TaxID=9888 RepID=A0A5N3VRU9_MUNMU|nr:hypothetical protein FD754_015982 [Muntiacus muntjak]
MGNSAGRSDFEWVYTDQPHTQRRKEMLGSPAPVWDSPSRLCLRPGIEDPSPDPCVGGARLGYSIPAVGRETLPDSRRTVQPQGLSL